MADVIEDVDASTDVDVIEDVDASTDVDVNEDVIQDIDSSDITNMANKTNDNVVITSSPRSFQVVSVHRDRCESLLRDCLNGNYTKTPEFAVEVWHYLSEAATRGGDNPIAVAHDLGERASHLLYVLSEESKKMEENYEKVEKKKDEVTSTSAILLFLSGVFASHHRLWSTAMAFFTSHFVKASGYEAVMNHARWVGAGVVGMHAFFILQESLLISALHICAWQISWSYCWRFCKIF